MATKHFTSPIAVSLPRKTTKARRIALNLNVYRNLDHFSSNNAKTQYNAILGLQLRDITISPPIKIKYTLHRKDKRKGDRSNVLSIVEKFFCDALVHYGCIPDDNDEYIISTTYTTGDVDKNNPRVDITIWDTSL